MADFQGTVPTRLGLELLGLLGTGVKLNFTRVLVGSGVWTPEQVAAPAEMTGLIKEEMTLAISPESVKPVTVPEGDAPAGCYAISVMLTNAGLENGFSLREIGLFATHPQRGEILFAVDYAGDLSDYVPALPANAAPLEKQFKLNILTGTAKEVFVNQAPVLLATHEDITDHNADPEAHDELFKRLATGTPEILNPADGATNIGETPIITAREFVPVFANTEHQASQWQVDLLSGNFFNSVFDSGPSSVALNSFELPAGYLQVSTIYKVRTRRRLNTGQWSPWSEPKIFTTKDIFNYVERPANVEPINGATNVGECLTLKSSPFAVVGDEPDTHAATQFRIRQGDTVLHLSPELGAVLEYLIPAGLLQVSSDYVFECRHKGTLLGWSDWSTATPFRTVSAFITGDEAVYPSTWVGHDDASSAGVALADDAALRSNGVDQDPGEGDWAAYSVRAKVRGNGLTIQEGTTAEMLIVEESVVAGDMLYLDLGSVVAGDISPVDVNIKIHGDNPFNDYMNLTRTTINMNKKMPNGCKITAFTWNTGPIGYEEPLVMKIVKRNSEHNFDVVVNQAIDTTGRTGDVYYSDELVEPFVVPETGDYFVAGYVIGGTVGQINSADIIDSEIFYGDMIGADVTTLSPYQCAQAWGWTQEASAVDISAGNFPLAPQKAYKEPVLTAATSPAGTPFVPADFAEIAIETATLGTDTDPDNPDFILLESSKQTPAESFRRVALGVSGLSKDSECRVSETQIDTWKQGA